MESLSKPMKKYLSFQGEKSIGIYQCKEHRNGKILLCEFTSLIPYSPYFAMKRCIQTKEGSICNKEKMKIIQQLGQQGLLRYVDYFYESFGNDGYYMNYCVMKYYKVGNLLENKERVSKWSNTRKVLNILRLFQGLCSLHENKIYHGRIDASAVLLTDDYQLLLGDIVEMKSSHLEVENAEIGFRADLFSMGYILYRILTGDFSITSLQFQDYQADGFSNCKNVLRKRWRDSDFWIDFMISLTSSNPPNSQHCWYLLEHHFLRKLNDFFLNKNVPFFQNKYNLLMESHPSAHKLYPSDFDVYIQANRFELEEFLVSPEFLKFIDQEIFENADLEDIDAWTGSLFLCTNRSVVWKHLGKELCKRILAGKPVGIPIQFILRLKNDFSSEVTSLLQVIRDSTSFEESSKFSLMSLEENSWKKFISHLPAGLSFSPDKVLNTWLTQYQDKFNETHGQGKSIKLNLLQGTSLLHFHSSKQSKPIKLHVTTLEMMVLLLFNNFKELSAEEIQDLLQKSLTTEIPIEHLHGSLSNLVSENVMLQANGRFTIPT